MENTAIDGIEQAPTWKFDLSELDQKEHDSWKRANQLIASVGRIPSNFSSLIRTIKFNEGRNEKPAKLKQLCRQYSLPWLKRSPTLKSVFFFAASSIYEEKIEETEKLDLKTLIDMFEPGEVAAILGLVYLSKRLEMKSDEHEWQRISSMMQIHMEIGALVGSKIEAIGEASGMLLGGMRGLSFGFLALNDLKSFKKYRREAAKLGHLFDLNEENRIWGCNHLQVASLLVQQLGFGLSAGLGFGLGMGAKQSSSPKEWFNCLGEEVQCWQAALGWIECLHSVGESPDFIPAGHKLSLSSAEESVLRRLSSAILAKGSTFHWITKRADDLSEEMQIRLGTVFNQPEEEKAIFEEIDQQEDYVDLS